ncbi:MAG: SAM-dependent DNA methyltransferase [Sedimentisphaerales bacterium]|nr:SAM-dependent DNA methyltransferase [Sedimentisphaerales bacterium]
MAYRKEYGQFFTPPVVSDLMVRWLIKDNPKRILDPAFGLGVFFDSVNDLYNQPFEFTGYEIDNQLLDYLAPNQSVNLNIINGDYLESIATGYEAIICNPPYLRFQNFLNRHTVLPHIEKMIGEKIKGYSNISSIFLLKAICELAADGRLAFIMPLEFFNTGYGEKVKCRLLENGLLKQIVIFENEKEVFPEAITTICLLLCQKDGVREQVKISRIGQLSQLDEIDNIDEFYQDEIEPDRLSAQSKWTHVISSLDLALDIPEGFVKIGEFGKFARGIATGANEFFALNKTAILERGIGDKNYTNCITKSPQVRKLVFTEDDFSVLADSDNYVFCLDIKDHNQSNVRQYLAYGESRGYHLRYLTANRSPWYKIENRQPAPILAGVFNRGRLKIVRNLTNSINFTCFHGFYPNMFGLNYINRLFVYLISDFGQRVLMANKRNYGNNLDKFEPGDLNGCYCPGFDLFDSFSEEQALSVVNMAIENESVAIVKCNELIDMICDVKACDVFACNEV